MSTRTELFPTTASRSDEASTRAAAHTSLAAWHIAARWPVQALEQLAAATRELVIRANLEAAMLETLSSL